MNNEIKEILDNIKDIVDGYVKRCNYNQDEVIYDEINYSPKQWYLLLDYITNLQEENEEIKVESEKLTQLWLNSQEKRRKAIEYLEQPYRDNFDYSKAELLNILQGVNNE